jgi:hypothetical protein
MEGGSPFLPTIPQDVQSNGVPKGGWGLKPPPPRNAEVLTQLSRIPSYVENTSVTT